MMATLLSTKIFWIQVVAALLVLLFSYAAFSKLVNIAAFEWQMLNQPLPRSLSKILTWVIPSFEIIIIWLLLIPSLRYAGFISAALLMIVFTLYAGAVTFHFFERVPCSCGGLLASMSWEIHLVFNIVFMIVSIIGVLLHRKHHDLM